MLEIVKLADQAGFDIVWAPEHHCIEYTIGPNPLLFLTQWAEHTSRIRLGTAVLVAPYWHPIRLAGEIGLVDILTGGRLEVGIARGAYQYEFDRMAGGIPQERGGSYLREMVPVLKKLWAGDCEHHGIHWSFPKATAVPKPLQKPHPPLWVAARDPRTFAWAVENELNIMATPLSKPFSEVENLTSKLETAMRDHPGHPRPRFMIQRITCVYRNPDDWRIPVNTALENRRVFEGLFQNKTEVINGFPQPIELNDTDTDSDFSPEKIRDNMMFGTPEEVVEKLRQYEAVGVDIFCYNSTFGLPHDFEMQSLELFATEVMPRFAQKSDRSL